MSTGVDARRRPSLWSYISFNSSPRRRSVTLPTRNSQHDPFEKAERHTSNGSANGPIGAVESLKTAWMTQSQRARYLRTGGVIAVFMFLFFLLSPNGRTNVGDFVGNSGSGSSSSDPSFGTTKCSKSYSSDKPLIQYALMIDAGSTGSRIHVYRFNNCGATPELEHEEFKMTEPKKGGSGLSSFGADAEGAARSLDVLMDVAMQTVPENLKSCSPVAVKATAGLRKLGPELSEKILEAVRTRLETAYPFPVVSRERDGVVVMEGKDEGVYAWITTNYLLGKIGGPDKSPTAAVFDLGGGSTQIVFQPTFKSPTKGMPDKLAEGDHKYTLNFGGRDFELYQHSHLGYGLMSARETMHKTLIQSVSDTYGSDKSWMTKSIEHPCIAPNMSTEVKVTLDDGTDVKATMVGPWTGAPAQCRGLAERILKKEEKCELAPCSFGGVHQPSLEMTFAREDVYIFSYFYDRTQPLGMPESFTLKELRDLTEKVCQGEKCWETFQGVDGAINELRDRPEYCLDLNFMMALLHTGYEMPIDREVRIAKKIKGNELGWCLGARYMILQNITARYRSLTRR
ncbi:Guanosine-diphosphatase [Xylographa parallela]|nr:Guanosine-diphosphatase [Xylographa parallela]